MTCIMYCNVESVAWRQATARGDERRGLTLLWELREVQEHCGRWELEAKSCCRSAYEQRNSQPLRPSRRIRIN